MASGCVISQQVVAALQVAVVGGELRAAVVGLAELELLDHRAHRAVEDGDAAGEEFVKPAGGGGGVSIVHA